jgi:hypothetical protein
MCEHRREIDDQGPFRQVDCWLGALVEVGLEVEALVERRPSLVVVQWVPNAFSGEGTAHEGSLVGDPVDTAERTAAIACVPHAGRRSAIPDVRFVDRSARLRDDVSVSEPLTELWARVRTQLEQARAQLTNPADEALFLYEDFLSHNELGLALDALADVALAQRAPGDVWRTLGGAVESMGLEPDDSVHGGTVEKILEQLSAAHDWRGLQQLLNEWDPIGVRPEMMSTPASTFH